MIGFLFTLAIVVIIVVAATQLSSMIGEPYGRIFQILAYAVGAIVILMAFASLIGVGPDLSLRLQ